MTDYIEGRMKFSFSDEYESIKFDDTLYYKNMFTSYMPEGKGVDFIAYSSMHFLMLEVKDFKDHYKENKWRTHTDSAYVIVEKDKVNTQIKINQYKIEESLDLEVAKKISSSIACLLGSYTQPGTSDVDVMKPFVQEFAKTKFSSGTRELIVILFVEGIKECKTRSKKMIMSALQQKIKEKLKWLNCKVAVVDQETCKDRYVRVSEC